MGKLTIQELSQVLVEKHGLSKSAAQNSVVALFSVISDGLSQDKQVKVKGLGTFKIIDVNARESVNVNTGERVLIDSHAKVSFTPDTTMKELVNKPFSSFETVVLNDGVSFEDMEDAPEETKEVPQPEEAAIAEEVQKADEPVPLVPTKLLDEQIAEEQEQQETKAEDSATEEPADDVVADEPAHDVVADEPNGDEFCEEHRSSKGWIGWLLLALCCCGLSFFGGYYVGTHRTPTADKPVISLVDSTIAPKDTMQMIPDSVNAVKSDTLSVDTTKKVQEVASAAPEEPFYKKYDDMDVRVRLGAYHIMGTAQVVKAKKGETLGLLSRRYLGKDMECYMEVYNGLKATDLLMPGQEIKIPKLQWKKKRNNH